MDYERDWPETFAERMRWARSRKFKKASEAARFLDIKPVTYRTYETEKGEGGRRPELTEIQRIARRFRVSWQWLAAGEGPPDEGVLPDIEGLDELNNQVAQLPEDDQRVVVEQMRGVIAPYLRRVK